MYLAYDIHGINSGVNNKASQDILSSERMLNIGWMEDLDAGLFCDLNDLGQHIPLPMLPFFHLQNGGDNIILLPLNQGEEAQNNLSPYTTERRFLSCKITLWSSLAIYPLKT